MAAGGRRPTRLPSPAPIRAPAVAGRRLPAGPGTPVLSRPTRRTPSGAWPSTPQWPSGRRRAGPADPRRQHRRLRHRRRLGRRREARAAAVAAGCGDTACPKRPPADAPLRRHDWSFGDRRGRRSARSAEVRLPRDRVGGHRPHAGGPDVRPMRRGDEYLPIFASVESAWFEPGRYRARAWGIGQGRRRLERGRGRGGAGP